MALICNKEMQRASSPGTGARNIESDHERCIESGSACFALAFAETLGFISDLEQNDPSGAKVRLSSMALLLKTAVTHYKEAEKIGAETALNARQTQKLRQAGLSSRGIQDVLREAVTKGLWKEDRACVDALTGAFGQRGYAGMMGLYLENVVEIQDCLSGAEKNESLVTDAVALQELGWKLTTLFTRALEIGKAVAILNTLTFRLPRQP